MAVTYSFLESMALSLIERDRMLALSAETTLGEIMPLGFQVGDAVSWDQRDSVTGLLPGKGLGSPLPVGNVTGGKRRSVPASYFGKQIPVDVRKIVSGGEMGTLGDQINIDDEVEVSLLELQYQLRMMQDLQRGQLLSQGTYTVYDKDENALQTYYWDEYDNRYLALTGNARFTESTTCKPINSLRMMIDTYFRGTGYAANTKRAKMLMNSKTASVTLASDEIKAYRMGGGNSLVSTDEWNEKFSDFPELRTVEGGAHLRAGTFSPYIPDGLIVIVGAHDSRGAVCGGWDITTSEVAGVGTSVFANVANTSKDGGTYPYNPIAELAVQGAAYIATDKQVAVLRVASQAEMDAYTY